MTTDDVQWQRSYDRESVDRYFAEVATEKARLEAGIRMAEEEAAEAERRLAERRAYGEAELGALVLEVQAELERMNREHDEEVARLRAEARSEAERILAEARAQVADIEDAAGSLTVLARRRDAEPADDPRRSVTDESASGAAPAPARPDAEDHSDAAG